MVFPGAIVHMKAFKPVVRVTPKINFREKVGQKDHDWSKTQ